MSALLMNANPLLLRRRQCLGFLAASATLGLTGTAMAAPKGLTPTPMAWPSMQVPYEPSSELSAAFGATKAWSELYALADFSPASLDLAVRALVTEQEHPPALGVMVAEDLHVRILGKAVMLKSMTEQASRAGKPLQYEPACETVPREGDGLACVYEGAKVRIRLDLRLMKRFAFGPASPLNSEWSELNLDQPAQCRRAEETRLIYAGKAEVENEGKLVGRYPVLMQVIEG